MFAPANSRGTDAIATATEIEVMRSQVVRDAVREELGYVPAVGISQKGQTTVVSISSESEDPVAAAAAANAYAKAYISTRRQQLIDDMAVASDEMGRQIAAIDEQLANLGDEQPGEPSSISEERHSLEVQRSGYDAQRSQLQLASNLTQTGGAQLVSEAGVPTSPVRPTPSRNIAIGVIMGFLLGVGAAFLRDYLDDSVKTKEELEQATGLTALGLIPFLPSWRDKREAALISMSDPSSPPAEAYRTLRTSIQFMSIERPIQLLQVTSPLASEGKTTTIANLAVAMARSGQRVSIVCCDLRRPRLHEFVGLQNEVGFTSVLLGHVSLDEALQVSPDLPGVTVLSSGPTPPNPSELLGSDRAAQVFADLRDISDIVLVDTPPVLPVTDALIVAGVVDATLLIASASRTSRRDVQRATELLEQLGAPLIGCVLNGVQTGSGRGYGYGYGYGYTYTASRRSRGRLGRPQNKDSQRDAQAVSAARQ
jgi:capsular exopolysaccharide synthesis family protein